MVKKMQHKGDVDILGVATAEGSSVKSAETQTTSHSPLLKSQGMAQSSGPRQLLQLKISSSRMGKS